MRNLILSILSTLALLISPLSLSAQNGFSLSVDANSATGDQAVTSLNTSADRAIAIQLFGANIQHANGVSARFEYDPSQVTYRGFDVGDVFPDAQALPEYGINPDYVEIGVVSLGGQASANSGLVGTIRFRTTTTFSFTAIRLVRAELGRGGQFDEISILTARVELYSATRSADFDGDGRVGFSDFLLFVDQFGNRQDDGNYEARYDLNGDGAIGFPDFLIFSGSFGKEVSGDQTQVTIPDANLRAAIFAHLGKASDTPMTQADMATLPRLAAPEQDIRDLTGLEFATGLTSLNLSYNIISDIAPLSGLTNLTSLDLSHNTISDIAPLSKLTNLTSLYLSANAITHISPLSDLTNLTVLKLHGNFFSNISPLSGLTRLELLSLYDITIRDRAFLSRLPNLSEANIPDANLRAAIQTAMGKAPDDPLTSFEMPFLSELEAPNANIRDLTGLERATYLTKLDLGGNTISDFSPLSGLTHLTSLWLSMTGISDVSALSNLTNLVWLSLGRNNISDVSALSGLTYLRYLDLSRTGISDVSTLSNLTTLIWLNLGGNGLSDVSVLSGLTFLRYLYLYNNNITDISPLVANAGLGSGDMINVRNNPLSATSVNAHIPTLQDRGVEVRFAASKPAPITMIP